MLISSPLAMEWWECHPLSLTELEPFMCSLRLISWSAILNLIDSKSYSIPKLYPIIVSFHFNLNLCWNSYNVLLTDKQMCMQTQTVTSSPAFSWQTGTIKQPRHTESWTPQGCTNCMDSVSRVSRCCENQCCTNFLPSAHGIIKSKWISPSAWAPHSQRCVCYQRQINPRLTAVMANNCSCVYDPKTLETFFILFMSAAGVEGGRTTNTWK